MTDVKELIKDARTIADSIHVHSSFQDWEAAEKDTLEKCADALETAENRIAELQKKEPTEKQVADYCRKRCLALVTGELCHKMESKLGQIPKKNEWIEVKDRLPQCGELVIIGRKDGSVSLGYCFQFGEHHLWNAIRLVPFSPYELPFIGAGHVTHWMPLPDAPEVGE